MATPFIRPAAPEREHGPAPALPIRSNDAMPALSLAYRLSTALVIVGAITAGIGVFHPAIFRETAWTTGNAQGTDAVILFVAIPLVVVSMLASARGALRARLIWLGALAYILYNSIFYAYGTHFNALFLLYTSTLSLAVWSVLALLLSIDPRGIRAHFAPATPVRAIAGYIAVVQTLFALMWLKDVVPGILRNTAPAGLAGTGMITNAVQVTDFAFFFPLSALAVAWLWQRRAWGYILAGAFVVYGVIEAISVATDQTFGHIHDASQSAAAVPIFVVLALIALVPAVVYLRNLR